MYTEEGLSLNIFFHFQISADRSAFKMPINLDPPYMKKSGNSDIFIEKLCELLTVIMRNRKAFYLKPLND